MQQAFPRPAYKPLALQIIHALSIHRLTTGGDIHIPIGPTAEELRDSLCLYHVGIADMGGDPAVDLLGLVVTVLGTIIKTVNGQFISKAGDTEQYYLDLKKDIDYDAQIDKRAEALSDDALDRAYFSAMKQLMERTDETTYVTGHQIWQYQIEWQERRVERVGYLFFGAPNDRPTAQPDRDFYIYFIQPFDPPKFKDATLGDEVFFRLKGLDANIKSYLARYAAALELSTTTSGGAKAIYLSKTQDALRLMSKWLQEKQMTAFEVTHQGKTKSLQDWVRGISLRDKARLGPEDRINFRDVVNIVSGLSLTQHFADLAPEYPTFSLLLTETNRKPQIINALRLLAGGARTKDAVAILDAMEMLDGDRIEPLRSRYAQDVLNRLKAKGQGQVINRSELLSGALDVEYFSPVKFRLEPDLFVVVLGGLVYSGDIVLSVTGDKIDSGKLAQLAERSLDELKQFKHIEAPKAINPELLRSLFQLLDIPPGLAQMAIQGSEEPVKQLHEALDKLVRRVLTAGTDMQSRLILWGQSLLREDEAKDTRQRLESLKAFTEALSPYNTIGKLKNLRIVLDDVAAQTQNLAALDAVENLLDLVTELGTVAAYLSQAEMVLPSDHDWIKQAQTTRATMLAALAQDRTAQNATEYRQTLTRLKKDYLNAYIAQHSKARLGVAEDKTKTALKKDPRLVALRCLAGIDLMPTSQLTAFEEKLDNLKSCFALAETDLIATPICPHCNFRPVNESLAFAHTSNALNQLDEELDRLLEAWQQTLLDNLDDPIIRGTIADLLTPETQKPVETFIKTRQLPAPVTPDFVSAVQEALSGLEKIGVTSEDIKKALLQGGSPATPEDLRKRFETFLNERCKGKDTKKLRFVVD